jgi:hypothetical protein
MEVDGDEDVGEGVDVEAFLMVSTTLTRALLFRVKLKLKDGAQMLPRIQSRLEEAEEEMPRTSDTSSTSNPRETFPSNKAQICSRVAQQLIIGSSLRDNLGHLTTNNNP